MAQALFDDHPIDQYLRESGEIPELMPGGLDEFSQEQTHDYASNPVFQEWLPRLLGTTRSFLEYLGWRKPSAASKFAERFKYIVISSSLLSPSLSSSAVNRAATPTTPGHFDQGALHSAATTSMTTSTVSGTTSHLLTFLLACLVPVAMGQGYYLLGLIILVAVKILADGGLELPASLKIHDPEELWTMTLENLEALVAANNSWDIIVSEALNHLETEEQTTYHPSSPFSPSSPTPSLRIALSSSLHTTQTQSDNVRHLLAALTSPRVLSQLSHMYAPPSPFHVPPSPKRMRPTSLAAPPVILSRSYRHSRPSSLHTSPDDTYTRARATAAPRSSVVDKRSTWNGSYMTLAGGPSPRRSRRRPNLSAVISLEDLKSPQSKEFSASSSTQQPLTTPTIVEDATDDADAEDEPFGVSALDLHRRRRSMRSVMFGAMSPSLNSSTVGPSGLSPSAFPGSYGSPLTSTFGSPFTSFNPAPSTSRQTHILSLSNIHLALQGAIGSKRFVCAHLLALRFSDSNTKAHSRLDSDTSMDSESDEESYWEDVRSVISLLTSTLEDASARLADALAETVRKQELERELLTDEESREGSVSPERVEPRHRSMPMPPSFAPMPSHLTRFAAHVASITAALDDAREHLEQCVASLREEAEQAPAIAEEPDEPAAALQSYERLRRELGLALRECERGRGTLLEIVRRHAPERGAETTEEGEGGDGSPVRYEGHFSSGESDKTLYNVDDMRESEAVHGEDHDPMPHEDDATMHLIMTSTPQHLPPPGIEQVFESVSAAQPFVRERSKLTREERIRLAKARRESRLGNAALDCVSDAHEEGAREGLGPGGEVVQELKDVIWKVSEQRRKMVERTSDLGSDVSNPRSPS